MSLAGRPSATLRPIAAVPGNKQRVTNELRRLCVCGKSRGVRPVGDALEIACSSCGRVALRVQFRNSKQAKQARAQFAAAARSGRS